MSRRRFNRYEELSSDYIDSNKIYNFQRDDSFTADQFAEPKPKIPWKSMLFIGFFFVIGLTFVIIAICIATGLLNDEKYNDRLWPIIILASLTFIPGAYYIRIIVCILIGIPDYTYDDIPTFNN